MTRLCRKGGPGKIKHGDLKRKGECVLGNWVLKKEVELVSGRDRGCKRDGKEGKSNGRLQPQSPYFL